MFKSIILLAALTASTLAHAGQDEWTVTVTPDPFSHQIVYSVNYTYTTDIFHKGITIQCDNFEHSEHHAQIKYGMGVDPYDMSLIYRVDQGEIVKADATFINPFTTEFQGDVIKLVELMINGETLYIRSTDFFEQPTNIAIPLEGFGKAYSQHCGNSA